MLNRKDTQSESFPELMSPPANGLHNNGLLTSPDQLRGVTSLLHYDNVPKPQELIEYSMLPKTLDRDYIDLEDELCFGMDGIFQAHRYPS